MDEVEIIIPLHLCDRLDRETEESATALLDLLQSLETDAKRFSTSASKSWAAAETAALVMASEQARQRANTIRAAIKVLRHSHEFVFDLTNPDRYARIRFI